MLAIQSCGGRYVVLLAVLLLGGCDSIMAKKQYAFPKAGEPSAMLRVEKPRSASVGVINLNDVGCWAGATSFAYKEDEPGTRVATGKEMVLTYNEIIGDKYCGILVALTPEENAIYTFKTGTWSKTVESLIPVIGKSREQGYCGLAIIKQVGTDVSLEPTQQVVVDRGIICYKYVKRKPVTPANPQQ